MTIAISPSSGGEIDERLKKFAPAKKWAVHMIKAIVKDVFKQYQVYKPMVATKKLIYLFKERERNKRFGLNHPDQKFYVIRCNNEKSPFYIGVIHGLLANYFYVLSHLKYASDHHWIPVVDQLNYPVHNIICGEVNGTENPWEYFWEQPSEYTLTEVYESRNVVLSKRSWFWQWDMGYDSENYTDREMVSFYHDLSRQVPLKADIVTHIDSVKDRLFGTNDRILGVSVRFDGHSKQSPTVGPGHPVAPEIKDLIDLVQKRLVEWGMDRVFLASDEQTAVERFQEAFGDRLIMIPRKRLISGIPYDENHQDSMFSAENMYETSLGYLTEMELLSKCSGLIGSVTSGLRYAVVRNNNAYKQLEIMDCGRFVDPNKRSGKEKH